MAAASDLAAMGAEPIALLVSLTLPEVEDDWLRDFTAGLQEACLETGLPLAGGDTTRGALSLTVTVLGSTPKAQFLTREGAKSGDRVCVSGTLGDASAGLAISTDKVAVSCPIAKRALQARFTRPAARLTLGQDLRGLASAAIDISDGLLADARHLATASDIAIEIDSQRIPLSDALRSLGDAEQALQWALAGGDDYELLFCLPPDAELPEGCTEIGRVVTGSGISCDVMPEQLGYDHFTHGPA
jgi:thiamine-monophosphate kinase